MQSGDYVSMLWISYVYTRHDVMTSSCRGKQAVCARVRSLCSSDSIMLLKTVAERNLAFATRALADNQSRHHVCT